MVFGCAYGFSSVDPTFYIVRHESCDIFVSVYVVLFLFLYSICFYRCYVQKNYTSTCNVHQLIVMKKIVVKKSFSIN